ncbi:MAG: DUF3887 domain-containing protein [Bacteroidales bacterium]|nr:DUF3887 domain-containing protein [Bacteroidales bacterium]
MKILHFLLASQCILLSAVSTGQDLRKLTDQETEQSKITMAEKFASEYFAALKNGSSYQFGDEATKEVKSQLTAEYQQNIYNQLKTNLGDFVSLEYAETWAQSGNPELNIIRFSSVFDKTTQKIEVRVVLNKADKIAGFFITPWRDSLN